MIARVLPDLPAVDRPFDYLVPDAVRDQVRVGTLVRIDLHGRRVRGWVIDVADEPSIGVEVAKLKAITKVSSQGPPPEVVGLAAWAAWRWAGRWVHLLRAASPPVAVWTPAPAPAPAPPPTGSSSRVEVHRPPPSGDRLALVLDVVSAGPALVVVPGVELALRLADRLRREGHRTALLAGEVRGADYALAASGTATVVGTRAAVWAPVPDASLHSILVLDEHDQALQSEGAPTWHARDVAVERARRAGVPCRLVSPVPTLAALAARPEGPESPPITVAGERGGWPVVEVVDRRADEPGRGGLFSSRLVDLARGDGRVVCVLNRTGRSRLLSCTACGQVADCERCGAAVHQPDSEHLVCGHCGAGRPMVCLHCGSGRFKNVRLGVSRAREELEALVGEPVEEVVASGEPGDGSGVGTARVLIGTEAVLHRLPAASAAVVAFLDLDQELLAPRYGAAEQAMALLARAARVAGARRSGGRLLLQTRHPDHAVVAAVLFGDPSRLTEVELVRRRALRMPPFGAVALVSGAGAGEWAAGAPDVAGVEVLDGGEGKWLVRATDSASLADYLALVERPPERTRIEVDPPRL